MTLNIANNFKLKYGGEKKAAHGRPSPPSLNISGSGSTSCHSGEFQNQPSANIFDKSNQILTRAPLEWTPVCEGFIYWLIFFFLKKLPKDIQRWIHEPIWWAYYGVCFFFPKRTAWPRLAFLQPLFMVKLFWDFHDFNICGPRCPRFPTLRNHCRGLKSPDETFPNRLQWGPSKCAREGALRSSPETESAELFEMLPNRRPSASHVAVLLKLGIFWNIFSWGRVKMRHLIPRVPV